MGFLNPDYRPTGAMQAGMYWARKRQRLARIAANAPLAYWTFDPATFDSPNFTDANGNVAVAGGDFSAGSIGLLGGLNGATFDGSGQVESSLPWTTTGAMGIRVYPTSYQGWQGPCGWKSNPTLGYCLFDNGGGGSPGTWRFVFNPANTSEVDITGPAVIQNQWCSLFAQWSWSPLSATWSFAFWINNTLIGTGGYSGSVGTLGAFTIGDTGDGLWNPFIGGIADVSVWNTLPGASARADYGVAS